MERAEKLHFKGIDKESLSPEGFLEDGRLPVDELFSAFNRLENEFGWEKEIVHSQVLETSQGKREFPICCFQTPAKGPAFWLFAGVHGEEPAGPNAIAAEIGYLAKLGREIPMIVFPLCNPFGYFCDWRYTNVYRDAKRGKSVGDMDWVLAKPNVFPPEPRMKEPSCPEAKAMALAILEKSSEYPPVIFFDLHEDESLYSPYIYSQGSLGIKDPIAHKVVEKLQEAGMPIITQGETRFKEVIHGGVVQIDHDASIDDLMSSVYYLWRNEPRKKNFAVSGIVVETPTILEGCLGKRVEAHRKIIRQFRRYWKIAGEFADEVKAGGKDQPEI